MHKHIYRILFLTLFAVTPLTVFGANESIQPDEMTRSTTSEIIELLKQNRAEYDADRSKLFSMVDERLLPYFDFRKMSQLVLGLNWRKADEKQRLEFTEEFKYLLVRTYAVALLKYTDQTVVIFPYTGKPTDKTVIVKANLKQSGGAPDIPVYTRFYNGKNGWKVIDVTIEGISLVTNYRNVYSDTIKNEGLDALIKSIAESNRKASNGKTAARN